MDHLPQLTEDNSSEVELNNIITLTGQYYQREIDSFLSQSNSLSQGDRKKDLKNFLDFSKLNFRKILRILSYSKDMLNDATNIYNYQNKIRMIHDERRSISQNFENQTNDDISMLKLPTVQPEITSYLMNQGNYNLANINVRGQVNFDSINSDVYETMNRTLQKKLCLSILPEEGLEYKINEGLLKITGPSFLLELTLFCDPRTGEYNWFLLNFEHKLQKFQNLEKKIGELNNEISKLYVEDKRDQEIYTIAFLVHKIKYLYSRKKLKSIIKKAESLRSQLESLGSEEVFDINQKTIAKDKIFFEIIYWKNSLLHSLNPQHRFNCLIFQLSNLSIFNFIEQYLKSPFELFSGLSEDEVTCVYHEPCLPQPEIIAQIQRLVGNANSLPINQNSYQAIYKILLFQTSKKIRLPGLSLDSNFFEIFKEVKNLFKVYQLFQYFCILYKKLKKSDLENIQLFLSNRDGLKSSNIAELNDVFIGIDIAGKILSVSVDLTNGGVDFNFEFLPKDVEIHKAKFNIILKEILRQNPLRFSELITLYKKILLLSSYSQFLFNNGAKFYPERGQNIDNFKSVTYISQGIHYTRQENTFSPVKITFSHKIEFDDAFENSSIRTDIQFSRWDAPASDQASLVHKSTISLVPFDLAKITQAFGDLITNKRCLAYYNFEIFKLENETGVNSTVSLNDTQKFLLKVSPHLDQNLTTANNTITITIKPSPPMSESYNTYINENAGTKLLFLAQKPKAYEIYEKNKLTLKYASVVDAKVQMQRDIERLENHVKTIGLKKNGLSFMPNSFFEQEEAENDIGVFKQELHSYSLYMLTNNIMLRFYYDKLFDLQPTRLQHMKAYPDGGMKYEKDPGFSRKLFLREMKQALPLLEFIFDLNEKRIDWMAQIRPAPEQENGQREKTAEDKEKEKMRIVRMAKIIGSYYYINVINLNPWHYVIYWRNCFEPPLISFFFNFQLISDGEYECFGIYCEPPNTLEPQRITETHAFHKPIRDIFNKCNPPAPAMNGAGVNAAHNPQKGALTIKIRNKGDLAAFVYQMTILLIKYSDFVNKSNSATNAAAANSSSS